ncbi:MAG: hypothetical protein P1U77_11230 [Rubripirellula sp.]|nr:hypothetical protein [Rubripirellula sp.]
MSSSNRDARPCDAVLMHNSDVVGPMRLPMNRADEFIALFNRVYAGLGISLVIKPTVIKPLVAEDEFRGGEGGEFATRRLDDPETERTEPLHPKKIPGGPKDAEDS